MGEPLRVGIVGIGTIATQYLATIDSLADLHLVAVSDLDMTRAQAVADARPGVLALTTPNLLQRDDVDVVLNLTTPAEHVTVALAAIGAGRGVYNEKPLATNTVDGRRIVEAASAAGVRLGCAPDTVLGTGTQTARRAIDDGLIGTPIAATATMVTPGHERWHAAPDFYYQPGGGPLFDMGPYYLSALVTLLGPVSSVTGMTSRMRDSRVIQTGDRAGTVIPVRVDSHVTALLRHDSGAISTVVMSFDAVGTRASSIEVHGESGTLTVPDPNRFGGSLSHIRSGEPAWTEEACEQPPEVARGVAVIDLAECIVSGDEPAASGSDALHVLDILLCILESAASGQHVTPSARP